MNEATTFNVQNSTKSFCKLFSIGRYFVLIFYNYGSRFQLEKLQKNYVYFFFISALTAKSCRPDNWSRRPTRRPSSPPRSPWAPSGWRKRGGSTERSAGRGPAWGLRGWWGRGQCRGYQSSPLLTMWVIGFNCLDCYILCWNTQTNEIIFTGSSWEEESQCAAAEQTADDSDQFLFQHRCGEMTTSQHLHCYTSQEWKVQSIITILICGVTCKEN